MTATHLTRKLTFEEYLNYDDETDNHYEFVDVEGFYEEKVYINNEQIVSLTFPELMITVEQLWNV